MNWDNTSFAFLLTLLAGLSTGIGSALAFFTKKTNTRFLTFSLGFSAGVMLYVSFVEIFSKSKQILILELGNKIGYGITIVCFFAGMIAMALIDKIVPSYENPHEMHNIEEAKNLPSQKLYRMGIFSALAITIHNFPEGIATFSAALKEPALGISIAVAIAIHNIPEGITISIPLFYSTESRKKAFWYSFLSGLSEPIGAILSFLLFRSFMNELFLGITFGVVAGFMVYIALDELLPAAEKYGHHHLSILGILCGMIIMASSLFLFA